MKNKGNERKTILIVCEGTNTEPDYFSRLQKAMDIASKYHITPEEKQQTSDYIIQLAKEDKSRFYHLKIESDKTIPKEKIEKNPHSSRTKNKTFESNDDKLFEELYGTFYNTKFKVIFDKKDAQPARYVKNAFLKEYQDCAYDELWAVFDKNGHTAHKEAYELAQQKINEKAVNIAFSSRSFEYWILLHFERINFTFEKSACKEGKKEVNCGIENNLHQNDCTKPNNQIKCIVGYIRKNTPLTKYAKSNKNEELNTLMTYLLDEKYLLSAFENASWLRFQMNKLFPSTPIYELNPYTNVDILVKSILGVTKKYVWTELGHEISIAGMGKVKVILNSSNQLEFIVKKINFNPHGTKIYLKNQERKITKLQVIETFDMITESNKFTIQIPQLHEKQDFCIEFGNEILLIEL